MLTKRRKKKKYAELLLNLGNLLHVHMSFSGKEKK